MLKHLQKFFNGSVDPSQKEVEHMTDQEKAALKAAEDKSAELSTALETATASFAEQAEAFKELTTKYEAAQAALSASTEAQATLVAQAKAKVMAERTASLSAVMGDVKGPATAAKLESLDDAAFAVVLDSYAASFEAEAASPMFKEQGVAAEAPAVEVDAVKQMAAKFAAEFNVK